MQAPQRLQSRRKRERVDSAQAYNLQELVQADQSESAGAAALLCGLVQRQCAHALLMHCCECMCRRRRLQSRRKWERVDSAQAYNLQEARSQSPPTEQKSPVEALAEHPEEQQSLSSIYLATESAPASPFGSLQVRHTVPRGVL